MKYPHKSRTRSPLPALASACADLRRFPPFSTQHTIHAHVVKKNIEKTYSVDVTSSKDCFFLEDSFFLEESRAHTPEACYSPKLNPKP
jgi:hypothetical protein